MKNKIILERGIQDIFSQKSGYTASEGDVVVLSGDLEVTKAGIGSPFPLGRVISTSSGVVNNGKLTIRTDYGSLYNTTAGEDLVAGPVVLGSDGKAYQWSRSSADGSGTVTFATNAAGNGAHTIVIDGVSIAFSPAPLDTPTTSAEALVALINATPELINKGYFSSNSSGVVTISCEGKVNNGSVISVSTADSSQTVITSGSISGGLGYPISSVRGLCITSTASSGNAPVLVKE